MSTMAWSLSVQIAKVLVVRLLHATASLRADAGEQSVYWQMAFALFVLIKFSTFAQAGSEPDYYPGIVGEDNRQIIDSWDHPWGAIGHVNVAGHRTRTICTGTLIAPKLVLTAAHCLVDHWKRKPYPMRTIHFVPGVRRGKSLGHSNAKCVKFPKNYRFAGPEKVFPTLPTRSVPFEHLKLDIALIVLEQGLSVDPVPLAEEMQFAEGLPLIHPAYAGDRRFMLSGDFTCQLLSQRDGVWGTNCDTHPGSSGGPVLVKNNDEYHLAAVMVGVARRLITFAVPASALKGLSLDENCP